MGYGYNNNRKATFYEFIFIASLMKEIMGILLNICYIFASLIV